MSNNCRQFFNVNRLGNDFFTTDFNRSFMNIIRMCGYADNRDVFGIGKIF